MIEGKSQRGGRREGSGRKVGWRKGYSEQRPQHQIRAHEDEWEIIKRFAKLVKKDKQDCIKAVEELEGGGDNEGTTQKYSI